MPLDSELWRVATLRAWNHRIVKVGHGFGRQSFRNTPASLHWTPVLDRNPDAMNPEPLPGHVWLDTPGKVLHAAADHLEFR
jgi:hypothetical protein